MPEPYPELAVVKLKRKVGGIPRGTTGTIVHVYENTVTDNALYEVEFIDINELLDPLRVCRHADLEVVG